MIAYFGKNSLKQAIRNKPIRFGYKAWCLATVSGYLVTFDLYQGVGVGTNHQANVVNVGASGASVLDLLDILPEDKRRLSYHIFGDNYFSSLKLVDSLVERNYNYTGRIRSDRLKGKPNLTSSDQFKKKTEDPVKLSVCKMIVKPLSDGMIINAPVTLISSVLGDQPAATCSRYSRSSKRYIEVPQPHVVKVYNSMMGGVDRMDQNINHLRISIGGKKWYWSIVTWLLDTCVQNSWQLAAS